MEFESPMDAIITFIGVSIVSIAILGVVLSFPVTPPPDANAAANTIDSTATSNDRALATYDHDGEHYWMDTQQIGLKNDGGERHASITFGEITPVAHTEAATDSDNEKLLRVTHSGQWDAEFANETAFLEATHDARADALDQQGQWQPASGELTVRKLTVDNQTVTLVAA